ncbi:MAG: P22 phage major capsid protein family protein [Opitutaceae bacterium]|jgi:hypothetical protein
MPNNFKKVDWVMMESLRFVVNKIEIAKYFNKSYAGEFKKPFAVGEKIQQKLPINFQVRDGMKFTPQTISERTVEITMDQPFGIDYQMDAIDKILNQDRGEEIARKRFIEPSMSRIVQEIERRCAQYATDHTPNVVGALGTTPTSIASHHQARANMVDNACPEGDWGMIISPQQHSTLGANLTTIMNPQKEISDLFRKGLLGNAAGFNWHESACLIKHTAGSMTASDVTVSATITDGATSVVLASAAAGATLKKGDILSFTTPFAVNPAHKGSLGSAKTVVLTQDCTIGGGGTATAYFEPALYGPGHPDQNVDVLPTAGHVVVLWPGTTSPSAKYGINGLALSSDAFALVFATFEDPKSAEKAITRRDPETGISISYVKGFDFNTRAMGERFDVLIGFGTLRPEISSWRVASLL